MPLLADTNILLRLVQRSDPEHVTVRNALRRLRGQGEQICFAPRNLVEFWRVCTRPAAVNGFGLTTEETDRRARVIERLFLLLPDGPAVHAQWRRLVVAHAVSGVQVHDARIVALMHVHGIGSLLTLDVADFSRYPGVTAIHPRNVLP